MLEEIEKILSELIRKHKLLSVKNFSNSTYEKIISGVTFLTNLKPNIKYENPLSLIEMICLIFVVFGKEADECAKILNVSSKSIRTYEQRIRKKLNAKNRANAFYLAVVKDYIKIIN